MADDGGLPLELLDGQGIVLRCLLNPLAGKDLRVVISLLWDGVVLAQEAQHFLAELLSMLKEEAVSRVAVEDDSGVWQALRHSVARERVDHNVVSPVGDEHGQSQLGQPIPDAGAEGCDRCQLGPDGLGRDRGVRVVQPGIEAPQRCKPALSSCVGFGKEQVEDVLVGADGLAHDLQDLLRRWRHVGDSAWPTSGDDQPAHEGRAKQRRGLDDVAAHGPAEQIDLREAERVDELEQTLSQTVDRATEAEGHDQRDARLATQAPVGEASRGPVDVLR
jgi:hypothetical protein